MIGLIQRVKHASVEVGGKTTGQIDQGLLVLLGVEKNDDRKSADKLIHKIKNYRVFPDAEGKMNLSVADIGGGVLLVSQFTLAADTKKGMRPSFSSAATPQLAEELYHYVVEQFKNQHPIVETGIFAADMQVSLCNDGPVTFQLKV